MSEDTGHPEIWKPIPGYEEYYEASSHGRIRSLDRVVTYGDGISYKKKGRILKTPPLQATGYPYVNLRKNGASDPRTVHSLVAEAFIGPRLKGYEVCHIDGSRTNNHVGNLRYGTSSENNYDIVKHGRNRNASKTHCNRGHRLEGGNLTPSVLALGRRQCLACVRARARVSYHKHLRPQLQEIADSYYAAIINTPPTEKRAS